MPDVSFDILSLAYQYNITINAKADIMYVENYTRRYKHE